MTKNAQDSALRAARQRYRDSHRRARAVESGRVALPFTMLASTMLASACADSYDPQEYLSASETAGRTDAGVWDAGAAGQRPVSDGGASWRDAASATGWAAQPWDASAAKTWDAGPDASAQWDAGSTEWEADGGDRPWPQDGGVEGSDANRADSAVRSGECELFTYETFGEQFLKDYCTRCHGGRSPRADLSFESLADVQLNAERVREAVLSGEMPKGNDKPSAGERIDFAQWIDCGPR